MASPQRLPDWARPREPPKFRDMTTTERLAELARRVTRSSYQVLFSTYDLSSSMAAFAQKIAHEVRGLPSLVRISDEFLENVRDATKAELIHAVCILYFFYYVLYFVYSIFDEMCLPVIAAYLAQVPPVEDIPHQTRNFVFGLVVSTINAGELVADCVTLIIVVTVLFFFCYRVCLGLKSYINPPPSKAQNKVRKSPAQGSIPSGGKKPQGAKYVAVRGNVGSRSPPQKANTSKSRSDRDIKQEEQDGDCWRKSEKGNQKQIQLLRESLELEKNRVLVLEAKVKSLEKMPNTPEAAKLWIDHLQLQILRLQGEKENEKGFQIAQATAHKRIRDLEKENSDLREERKTAEGQYLNPDDTSSRPPDYKYRIALDKYKKEKEERTRLETAAYDHLAQIDRLHRELKAEKKAKKDKERPYERELCAARKRIIAQDAKMGELHKLTEKIQAKEADFAKLQELMEETRAKLE
ncbi:hypothetical protein QQZ08_011116 [Neonectria magnoliae]|uniref:Uncharacterized protein n=1 Tax=Neonectria magnoliae TaxID=2732573 RepID=A0ABR1HCA3_9HYPO